MTNSDSRRRYFIIWQLDFFFLMFQSTLSIATSLHFASLFSLGVHITFDLRDKIKKTASKSPRKVCLCVRVCLSACVCVTKVPREKRTKVEWKNNKKGMPTHSLYILANEWKRNKTSGVFVPQRYANALLYIKCSILLRIFLIYLYMNICISN